MAPIGKGAVLETAKREMLSRSVQETEQLGERLGALLRGGEVICLSGDLGAGKTAFTRGIGRGWGAAEPVTSPTFTLVHEHHRARDGQTLYHVDCYRLGGAADAWTIGLDELLHGEGVAVIEWPENVADALPAERLWVTLDFIDDQARRFTFRASGARHVALLAALD